MLCFVRFSRRPIEFLLLEEHFGKNRGIWRNFNKNSKKSLTIYSKRPIFRFQNRREFDFWGGHGCIWRKNPPIPLWNKIDFLSQYFQSQSNAWDQTIWLWIDSNRSKSSSVGYKMARAERYWKVKSFSHISFGMLTSINNKILYPFDWIKVSTRGG